MRHKWRCEVVKTRLKEITNTEMNEKLENIWEMLQALGCQPIKFSSHNVPIEILVEVPVKPRRST